MYPARYFQRPEKDCDRNDDGNDERNEKSDGLKLLETSARATPKGKKVDGLLWVTAAVALVGVGHGADAQPCENDRQEHQRISGRFETTTKRCPRSFNLCASRQARVQIHFSPDVEVSFGSQRLN